MNKLEVGMYVRTKNGIGKVTECRKHDKWGYIIKILGKYSCFTHTSNKELSDVIKASFNIIDLIEEGDILLLFDKEYGEEYKAEVVTDRENFTVVVNYEQNDLLILEYELITNEHIELLKILTKEQFESMSYRIGE